jgi:hypothetical protein
MKSLIASLLVLTLGTPAFADEPACVRGYRLANADFYSKTDNLNLIKGVSDVAKVAGGPATAAICVLLSKRSWWGFAGCAFLGVVVSGSGYVGSNMSAASIVRERSLKQMESSFITYQIYRAHRAGEAAQSPDVAILLRALGVDVEDNQDDSQTAVKAAGVLAELMESGALCDANGNPSVDYYDMLPMITERL